MKHLGRLIFVLCVLALSAVVCAVGQALPPAKDVESQVRAVLEQQAAAWNRGDVAGFMQEYWKSEKVVFVGREGVTRGWQTVFDRYKRTYPNRAAMGKLTFSDLEITRLSGDAALVLGRWQLERAADRPGGYFTLILRRFREGWRIIHDHTSSLAPPASKK
jgi:ketosteroid isomerase-like protein